MKSETPNLCIISCKPLLMEFQTTIWWLVYQYTYTGQTHPVLTSCLAQSPHTPVGKWLILWGSIPEVVGSNPGYILRWCICSCQMWPLLWIFQTTFVCSPNPFWEEIKKPKPLVKKLQTTFGWFKKIQTTFGWFKKNPSPYLTNFKIETPK